MIRKHDPYFDLIEFESEVEHIVRQVLNASFRDDIETLKLLACEQALALTTTMIKQRLERKAELKYKEVLYLEKAVYVNAFLINEDTCKLRFRLNAQEINCLVDKKEGKIVEGDDTQVESCQYVVDLMINQDPVVEEVGHHWIVSTLERVGVVKQLI